jgi:hypothetical protein
MCFGRGGGLLGIVYYRSSPKSSNKRSVNFAEEGDDDRLLAGEATAFSIRAAKKTFRRPSLASMIRNWLKAKKYDCKH